MAATWLRRGCICYRKRVSFSWGICLLVWREVLLYVHQQFRIWGGSGLLVVAYLFCFLVRLVCSYWRLWRRHGVFICYLHVSSQWWPLCSLPWLIDFFCSALPAHAASLRARNVISALRNDHQFLLNSDKDLEIVSNLLLDVCSDSERWQDSLWPVFSSGESNQLQLLRFFWLFRVAGRAWTTDLEV